jgi:predicted permease
MTTDRRPRPPRLARVLLRMSPLGSRRAEVTADLDEVFAERAVREGRGRASLRYYGDVLSLWRWNFSATRLAGDAARDLVHGLRIYRRNPGSVGITVLGLSLAIAVSTAVFSMMNVAIFRAAGVSDPDSAIRVMRAMKGGYSTSWSYADYLALREHAPMPIEATLRDGARFSPAPVAVSDDTVPRVTMAFVGGDYQRVFGARLLHGRMLTPADDSIGAPTAVVASYGFWARRLGADPEIVGRRIWLNGVPATLVGVTDRSFTGLGDQPPAFWATFASYHVLYSGTPVTRTSRVDVSVYGRTLPGQTLEQTQAQLSPVAAAGSSGGPQQTTGVRLESAASRFSSGPDSRTPKIIVTIVMTIVGLVVLLACVNVANLLLAGAAARQREIGVRLALGAPRRRIIRQLVTESLALGLVAGAIALVLTTWLVPMLAALVRLPVTVDMTPDVRVYFFLAVVSIAAGVGAGLAPARHGTRGDLVTSLKGDGPRVGGSARPSRMRATLIGVQAAASLVLLVLAALLTRATLRATTVDVGFDPQPLISIAPAFGRERYDAARAQAYWALALERLRALPGVRAAALTVHPPFGEGHNVRVFRRDGSTYRTYTNDTDAEFFSTIGLRVVRGRTYTREEVAARAHVAVISETLARDFWPGENPVGQTMARYEEESSRVIIGVVSDAIAARMREMSSATVYLPIRNPEDANIIVRSAGAPEAMVPALRDVLQPLDSQVRLDVTLVSTGLQRQLDEPRIMATLAGGLALLALGLAVVGIYGVTTFVTGQRTREIGLRIAVGASRADVVRLLLVDSLRPVAIGLAAGAVVALLASQVFAGVLYGVGPRDPVAFAGATVILLAAAAAAIVIPTRRAARVDPAFVLRQS